MFKRWVYRSNLPETSSLRMATKGVHNWGSMFNLGELLQYLLCC